MFFYIRLIIPYTIFYKGYQNLRFLRSRKEGIDFEIVIGISKI